MSKRQKAKLGKAFSDSVFVERHRDHRLKKDSVSAWWMGAGRILIFSLLFFAAFFILSVRLFSLTVVNGHKYKLLADGNRTRELIRHAPRGILLDRTGKPLSENIPRYRLLKPCQEGEGAQVTGGCVTYISKNKGEELTSQGLPAGSFLEIDWERRYIDGEAYAHVTGYTGEITEEELKDAYYTIRNYRRGDRIGRTGTEAVFEERLRGRDGKELVEVESTGKIVRTLGRDSETPGNNVILSIDRELSKAVRSAFPAALRGAVVVSKPSTGEILALYSSPTYNPDVFTTAMSNVTYSDLTEDPDRPLFNRAIGGVYPPASTFKIITAVAALESGAITKQTTVEDTGVITTGPFSFSNWYFTQHGKTDGFVDVVKALQRSNDIYFYRIGEKTGIDTIATWARIMGVGKTTGIELFGEAQGLMPDPKWKEKRFTSPADLAARNNLWYSGDTYHVSIGQGYLLTTPLQVNLWTNIIANGGRYCRPTIEKVTSDNRHPAVCFETDISEDVIRTIRNGMEKACEAGGTGWPMFEFRMPLSSDTASGIGKDSEASPSAQKSGPLLPVACKTGTAEFGDPADKTHAWFTVFAPVPAKNSSGSGTELISGPAEISVTVLIEEGGEGSSQAAPIAKEILTHFFMN
jgi:penicillin-binding protein 2